MMISILKFKKNNRWHDIYIDRVIGKNLGNMIKLKVNLMRSSCKPREWTIFNCFLTILPPSVAILKMINFTLGHKCKPRLPYPLLPLLLTFTPTKYVTYNLYLSK